jgi:intracellular sulfur oxidation DsrE/DsrF family protein
MSTTKQISDEILSAHIDNELDPAERATLLDHIAEDSELRARACELWQLKQMVRGAYPLPRQKAAVSRRSFAAARWLHALAATLLLMVGSISGWMAHGHVEADRYLTSQIDAIRADGGRVVLHLFSDEPKRMETALSTLEKLANARDHAGQPFRVELIANGPGLHLLRTGGSPYAARIAALHDNYANLSLIACHQAIERMRDRGIDVTLLPGVEEAPSAESELANRLTQGWRYIQS